MGTWCKTLLLWLWRMPIVVTVVVTIRLLLGHAGDLWVFPREPLVARDGILNVPQVVAGIVAIMITVIAIIVQISATRCTPQVMDLFLANPIKILIFFACVLPLFTRGVRKSQAMLAGFFTRAKRLELALRILDGRAGESRGFHPGIHTGSFTTQSREFREIEDRGVSFYYVGEPHRESVHEFFSWLLGKRPLPHGAAQSA